MEEKLPQFSEIKLLAQSTIEEQQRNEDKRQKREKIKLSDLYSSFAVGNFRTIFKFFKESEITAFEIK